MQTWRLVTHHEDPEGTLQKYLRYDFIALGWGLTRDLRILQPQDASGITEVIRRIDDYKPLNRFPGGGRCLWGFYYEMKIGDLVILSIGQGPLRHVVEVTGVYEYWDNRLTITPDDYYHCRKVSRRSDLDGRTLWIGPGPTWNRRWPLVRVS